ncbi:MAG: type II toxin-antitoxin system PemK/MazF family toxin [Acetobacteraceae bacterium]|jgi:mRNA interferase MazF
MSSAGAAGGPLQRGSIWWVDLDPTRGAQIRKQRPAVVLSADGLNRIRRAVVVVPLSAGLAPRPPIIVVVSSAGKDSVAVCDQLRAVDRTRFIRLSGTLSRADLRAVEAGVRAVLLL